MKFGKNACDCIGGRDRDTIAYSKFCAGKDIKECRNCICFLLYDKGITTDTITLTGGVTLVLLNEKMIKPDKNNKESSPYVRLYKLLRMV